MKINELTPALTKGETELNLYIKKAENFSKDMEKYKEVNNDNYDLSKKLKGEILSSKTSIEKSRKLFKAPLLDFCKTIDERALKLKKPFQDMQDEMTVRINIYEKEENDRKEKEKQRIQGIVDEIYNFTKLNELSEFYKKLDKNDQKRKQIMEAGTLSKNSIIANNRKRDIESIKTHIANTDTLEGLKVIVVGEYGDDGEIKQALSDKKERITFNIQQKQLKEQQDEIKRKQDEAEKERKEHNDKLLKEENERLEKQKIEDEKMKNEKQKILNDKIDISKQKIDLFQTVEELNNYMNSLIEDEELSDAINDNYNKRKNILIEIEEDRKREKEVEENNEEIKIENYNDTINKYINKGFSNPNTREQLDECLNSIEFIYDKYDRKTDLTIELRDFILNFIKD